MNITAAFTKGRKGVSIWLHEGRYQVSVRQRDGSFAVGIATTIEEAYRIALREPEDDLL